MRSPLKALFTIVLAALAARAAALQIALDLSGRELRFSKSGQYDFVVLEGAVMTTEVGAPALPALAVNIVVPQGMRVTRVTCSQVATEAAEGSFLILPAQPPRPLSDTKPAAFVPPDPAVYGSAAPYPSELGRVTGQSSMQGYNIASLLVYPLRYSPEQRTLEFFPRLALDLALEPTELGYLPIGKRSEERRKAAEDDVRSVVVNPDDVSRFAPSSN
jgi:hypothetical protein